MLIRRVEPAEHAAVGEVTVAANAAYLAGEAGPGPYAERLRDTATRDREAEVWVAVADDGALLGTVTICPSGSPLREIGRDGESEFRMLAVAPDAQRHGVGEALVRFVVDRGRAAGHRAVVLCSLDRQHGAHRLYERLGFRRLPDRDWSPRPGISLLAFRLEL
ncbi:GNAT family N-acetyltransferase [Nocardioides ferulae]|uniref:GNAT family N-acetyltransferase n=1 Tax=Nocardioides ferulae TaxID=2340821 RepID=UPI000EB46912|nr:GNAT family N-acetyltransferase [Nocardioides ferulae]